MDEAVDRSNRVDEAPSGGAARGAEVSDLAGLRDEGVLATHQLHAGWIDTRVISASRHLPLVTQNVLARMKDLLVGELSERHLSKMELARVAAELIEAMASVAPKTEAEE